MSGKKNQRRKESKRQERRHQAAKPSASRVWIVPFVVLAVGLVPILIVSGVFDQSPEEAAITPLPASAPPALAESGVIPQFDKQSWDEIDDPSADGWETEVLHDKVKKQLKVLGSILIGEKQPSSESLAKLLDPNFACTELRPEQLTTAYQEGGVVVRRGEFDSQQAAARSTTHRGVDGLSAAISDFADALGQASEARFEFKVVRVDPTEDDLLHTQQLLELSARTPTGMIEQHATWDADWVLASGKLPQLKTIRISKFEETRTEQDSGPLFADCTESVLSRNNCYPNQILRGLNHWLARIPYRSLLSMFAAPGIAVADVNGDGLEDVYLCQQSSIPNRLFLQQPDGSARDVSAEWGVDWINDTRSALFVDLDNDGDQDLAVAVPGSVVLAENLENRRFRIRVALPAGEDPSSLCAFDYELDGRLDIYVCAYYPNQLLTSSAQASPSIARAESVFHDANDSAPNTMYRNAIEPGSTWEFIDVTEQVGLDENNRRWSLAAASEDYDNDGDPDLYVANDYGRDNLYRNDLGEDGRRTFVDVGLEAQVEQAGNGMGITWADYNLDGWMDAYVSNMWSSAGNRVATRPQFMSHAAEDTRERVRHFAVGNTLLRNQGGGVFDDRSLAAGVNRGRWAWGNQFFDLNNDGWDDLIVANGYITTDDTSDL